MSLYSVFTHCGTYYEQNDGTKLTHPQQQNQEIKLAPFTVDSEKWGDFLCAIFDEWLKEDVGTYFVQLFDAALANWVGATRYMYAGKNMRTCRYYGI
jgi:sulfatase maturation enzyme AslB (radical SAM superfamily)